MLDEILILFDHQSLSYKSYKFDMLRFSSDMNENEQVIKHQWKRNDAEKVITGKQGEI